MAGTIACRVLGYQIGRLNRSVPMGARYFRLAGVMFLLSAGFSMAVRGQSAAPGDASKPLTVEASLNLRNVGDLQFSADPSASLGASGARLAFVVTEPAKGTGRLRHIWIYDRGSGVARQITFSAKSELAPRWSPDGRRLA